MLDFAKLILETEAIQLINGKIPDEELKKVFVDALLESLSEKIVESISMAKFDEPHIFRYKLQIHAQKKEELL